MDVNGKVFVVTGAGNGIGREVALLLLGQGAFVAGLDIKGDWLEETAGLAGTHASRFAPFVVDITNRKAVLGLPQKVEKALGPVDDLTFVSGISDGKFSNNSDGVDTIFPYFFSRFHD